MPITTEWIVKDRVILTRLTGIVRQDEIETWLAKQQAMVAAGTPLVHHISDGLELKKMDVDLKTFQKIMSAIPRSRQFGWHLEVTTNPLSRMTSAIVSAFAHVRARSYPSIAKAIAFLKENDPTLVSADWQQY